VPAGAPAPSKTCTRCGAAKPATPEWFGRRKDCKLGLAPRCKACDAAAMRAYRKAAPEKIAGHERKRHKKHRRKRLAYSLAYYETNACRLRERRRVYRAENRERLLANRRAKREIDKTNPHFQVTKTVSNSLSQALRNKKSGAKWETIVGYTLEELIRHLERQFERGMSWANYGVGWNIDHIRPVSSFRFATIADPLVTECWALTNLRPLWRLDNLGKHARRTHLI
jgi:hypothetical protein